MAYQGYDLKLGDWIFPYSMIRAETYSCQYNDQDVDSYVDNNGRLERTALPVRRVKIEFNTPTCHYPQMQDVWRNIRRNYVNATERKLLATFFVDELDEYKTDYVYLSTPKLEKYTVAKGDVMYKEARFAFIGYGDESLGN